MLMQDFSFHKSVATKMTPSQLSGFYLFEKTELIEIHAYTSQYINRTSVFANNPGISFEEFCVEFYRDAAKLTASELIENKPVFGFVVDRTSVTTERNEELNLYKVMAGENLYFVEEKFLLSASS